MPDFGDGGTTLGPGSDTPMWFGRILAWLNNPTVLLYALLRDGTGVWNGTTFVADSEVSRAAGQAAVARILDVPDPEPPLPDGTAWYYVSLPNDFPNYADIPSGAYTVEIWQVFSGLDPDPANDYGPIFVQQVRIAQEGNVATLVTSWAAPPVPYVTLRAAAGAVFRCRFDQPANVGTDDLPVLLGRDMTFQVRHKNGTVLLELTTGAGVEVEDDSAVTVTASAAQTAGIGSGSFIYDLRVTEAGTEQQLATGVLYLSPAFGEAP